MKLATHHVRKIILNETSFLASETFETKKNTKSLHTEWNMPTIFLHTVLMVATIRYEVGKYQRILYIYTVIRFYVYIFC